MCPPFTPFFFPLPWLACWAAGAATAWASRAAQMSASSTPNSSEIRPLPMPALGSRLLSEHVKTLRLNPNAPLVRRPYVMRRLMPVGE